MWGFKTRTESFGEIRARERFSIENLFGNRLAERKEFTIRELDSGNDVCAISATSVKNADPSVTLWLFRYGRIRYDEMKDAIQQNLGKTLSYQTWEFCPGDYIIADL